MSSIRTIRRLDRRPGEPAEEIKQVNGITIEKGIPLPAAKARRSSLREIVLALEPGESFTWPNRGATARAFVAKQHGRSFAARPTGSGDKSKAWRIWRAA